jgi:quercetin 2,3-dioxygenase
MSGRITDRLAPVIIRRDIEIHRELLEGRQHTARLHFSYGDYADPANMGIGVLRVFNHEFFPESARLSPHPHSHAQRITYVVAGELEHSDDGFPTGRVSAGGVQRITLSSHTESLEWNPSSTRPLELLQIWLVLRHEPDPRTEQRQYYLDHRMNRWLTITRPHGEGGQGVAVDTDASIHVTHLEPSTSVTYTFAAGHGGYTYVISGDAELNAHPLQSGDAAMITDQGVLAVEARTPAELILVDTAL